MEAFLQSDWAIVAVLIMVMGSLVDIFQFMWIVRRVMRRVRSTLYHRVRRDLEAKGWRGPDEG